MGQINLKDVTFGYSDVLFEGVNLNISQNDRLGIVGNNGEGKSSLLRCIAGLEDGYSGEITKPKGARIGYVDQSVPEEFENKTMYQLIAEGMPEIERASNEWRVEVALDSFGVPSELRERMISELSGGWQRMSLIARSAISDPDALLLDEPTNHLDLGKIIRLERWLNEQVYNVPIIVVSHDRAFLDKCTNKTGFLRADGLKLYNYSFSRARELLFEDDRSQLAKRSIEMEELKRIEKSAHKQRQIGKDNYSDTALQKAKQLERRAASLRKKLTDVHVEETREISLETTASHNRCLLRIEDQRIETPDGSLLFAVKKLEINNGDRVVLLGTNGSGKSTFFSILSQFEASGRRSEDMSIHVPPSVSVGIVDQHLANISGQDTLREFIAQSSKEPVSRDRVTSLLASAGFNYAKQDVKISTLSYGQKARLNLVGLRLKKPTLFLMDEPTNHLDISGQETLEREVLERTTGAIIISHDRRFIKNLGTRYLLIQNGLLREIADPEDFYETEFNI